jgi:hypothetical protein
VISTDIVLFDDEDDTDSAHLVGQTEATGRAGPSMGHVHTVDDAEGTGNTSAKANNLGLIRSGVPGTNRPPAADRAPNEPTLSARGWKCLCITAKRSNQGHCAARMIS